MSSLNGMMISRPSFTSSRQSYPSRLKRRTASSGEYLIMMAQFCPCRRPSRMNLMPNNDLPKASPRTRYSSPLSSPPSSLSTGSIPLGTSNRALDSINADTFDHLHEPSRGFKGQAGITLFALFQPRGPLGREYV